jgi:hypothetical protein
MLRRELAVKRFAQEARLQDPDRFVNTFDDYAIAIATDEVRTAKWANIWRLGVVVFTRPEEKICHEVIGPSLHYLHELTGEKVHFYFVGFFTGTGFGHRVFAGADFFGDGQEWYFSPQYFASRQTRFEELTAGRWRYSGGTDLLIVPYRIRLNVFYVDASAAIDLKLSRLARENHHYTPDELIQILVRELKQGKDIDGVSNSRIMDGVKVGLKTAFTSWVPSGLAESFKLLEPFAVRKLA